MSTCAGFFTAARQSLRESEICEPLSIEPRQTIAGAEPKKAPDNLEKDVDGQTLRDCERFQGKAGVAASQDRNDQ